MTDLEFEAFQTRVSEAVSEDELRSVYAGIVHENGQYEYYFGTDTEDVSELRSTAAVQLGMLLKVLADRSNSDIDEITDLAVERAAEMQLR
ncbi:hypothetical protein [Natrinema sp. 74]|uniref:hypothetical protein n=1 Tax=Natrinema sp. 74 TaxID=3384159 RepID=UPI0038D4A8B9